MRVQYAVRLFLIHKMWESFTFWSQIEGEYMLVRWIHSSFLLLVWKKDQIESRDVFLVCLSCVSGS